MNRKRAMVVDDEPAVLDVVKGYLERDGFDVETCATVADALRHLEQRKPDILILDVTLPDGSGFDILRSGSKSGERIPTIMLTARGDETDRVVGLELGADDYVTKPFSPRELSARVGALLRRVNEARASSAVKAPRKTLVADLEIDHDFHEVTVSGRDANLTATEFRILALLAQNPGEVFTRAHLLDKLGDDGEIYERTLDRHINNLRKKIERDPGNPGYVLTVYGVGYRMRKA